MISIIKNDFNRMLTKKALLLTMVILTAGSILIALFFTTRTETTANIAITAADTNFDFDSPQLNITILEEAPPLSALVTGTYDAIVEIREDGTLDIVTVKNSETEEAIRSLLLTGVLPDSGDSAERQTGATIVGYLVMFLLMEASMIMSLLGEDKEHKQITRVTSSPVAITKYVLSHCVFTFGMLFTATMTLLYLIKVITGTDIGFSFPHYALLIALITAFATVFSLLMNAITSKSDNANMLTSTIVMLTSILAGSFYSFDKGNELLASLIRFLPQKAYLTFTENLEQGLSFSASYPQLIYLFLLMVLFVSAAIIKLRKDYIKAK